MIMLPLLSPRHKKTVPGFLFGRKTIGQPQSHHTQHLDAHGVVRVVLGSRDSVGGLHDQIAPEHGQSRDAVGLRVDHLVLALAQSGAVIRNRIHTNSVGNSKQTPFIFLFLSCTNLLFLLLHDNRTIIYRRQGWNRRDEGQKGADQVVHEQF